LYEEYKFRKASGEKATQAVGWAKHAFRLDRVLNQSSISRILRDGPQILRAERLVASGAKRNRAAAAPRLKNALFKWICARNNDGVALNGELVIMQAEKLLALANAQLPDDRKISVKFSNGWIARFKKRHGIRFRRMHGEERSADNEAIKEHMPRLHATISTYTDKDVRNADEFGLFFRQPPSWTLSNKPVSSFKKEKHRLTFLACCNSNGSEKFPLMIIGNAERPRPFKKKYGRVLGLDWHFNKKAWMTRVLFFEWLERLDRYIGTTQGRKILLLIDNCSAHGNDSTIPRLKNVRVAFLPPNTTSKI